MVRALARSGARVMVTDILEDAGRASTTSTDEADWERALAATVGHRGRLDVVVNNAGIETAALRVDCELADFRRVMAANAGGCFLGTKWAMWPGGMAGQVAPSSTCPQSPALSASSDSVPTARRRALCSCSPSRRRLNRRASATA
ncbi:SDR family oxidoreductase [Pseudomonas sp. BF-R-19]|uniref:SDR family oxidoreductase n=1 Tax=Pseudomonas sp. BF-R-19 TaxID=2832397 RepID=UPI0039891765